ncbi:MAG: alpha/beta hydrolase fold domain-containing protein, partial [Eubacterium sp.]|nr:alpha/beta hydrolase fold domain-containing protein [Eubacterium sp.]
GGFISHDKKVDSVFANVMAQNGFVVFSLNYRLAYPKYTVFDQIDDIDKATRWIVQHASTNGNYN